MTQIKVYSITVCDITCCYKFSKLDTDSDSHLTIRAERFATLTPAGCKWGASLIYVMYCNLCIFHVIVLLRVIIIIVIIIIVIIIIVIIITV